MIKFRQNRSKSMSTVQKLSSTEIDKRHYELLKTLSDNACVVSTAAGKLKITPQTASDRLRKAIRLHGEVALIREFPGAAPEILRFVSKDTAQFHANSIRPPIISDHPEAAPHDSLLDTVQDKLALAIAYLDRFNLSKAKVSELNSTIKTLFEVSQVLQGRPTSISRSDNQRALKELVPALNLELYRRGMVEIIEGEVLKVVETPRHPSGRKVRKDKGKKKAAAAQPQALEARCEATKEAPPWAEGVGGSGSGPIDPKPPSEFSKLLDSF